MRASSTSAWRACSRSSDRNYATQALSIVSPFHPAYDGATRKAELQLRVPVCLSGTTQLQANTLSVTVFLEEPMPQTGQYYMQAALPTPMNGAFLTPKSLDSGVAVTYTAPLALSQFANTADQIVLQIGTYGAPFTGIVWIDDIQIQ